MPAKETLNFRHTISNGTEKVVIVGAGPYGLSTAAYLQDQGIEPYVVGKPMAFWKQSMPSRMLLRSKIEASNISSPHQKWTLAAYQKSMKRKLQEPLPIEDFIAYGEWVQEQVAPRPDTRYVRSISKIDNVFHLDFSDGDRIAAETVVLALGIGFFSHRPEQFAEISLELAPHCSDLGDLSELRGKRIAVVGKGQSALEYAALLHEHGAEVQIITRGPALSFRPFAWRKHLFRKLTAGPLRPLSYKILPPTDLGDIHTARKMADPKTFQRQSAAVQDSLLKDCTRPIGAYWLRDRLEGVLVRTNTNVEKVELKGTGLQLYFSDATIDEVDLAVLGTGYKIDISKYRIFDEGLQNMIDRSSDGYPLLDSNLQTSVRGLFMSGVVAERTLGPTLRFVTGTSNAGPRVAAGIRDILCPS